MHTISAVLSCCFAEVCLHSQVVIAHGRRCLQSAEYSYNLATWTGGSTAYKTCNLDTRGAKYVGACKSAVTCNTTLSTDATDTSLTDVSYTCSDNSTSTVCAATCDQQDWCAGLCYCGSSNCTSSQVTDLILPLISIPCTLHMLVTTTRTKLCLPPHSSGTPPMKTTTCCSLIFRRFCPQWLACSAGVLVQCLHQHHSCYVRFRLQRHSDSFSLHCKSQALALQPQHVQSVPLP